MNIVKWIGEKELTIFSEHPEELVMLRKYSINYYKRPKTGKRISDKHYYIRYQSKVKYSIGPYEFPDNPVLEDLCIKLNRLGFVFWGTFKTEIAPQHFMENMLKRGKIESPFRYIEAGEEIVKIKNA